MSYRTQRFEPPALLHRSNAPKVLHVVESLHRGAVENWLIRMLAHAKASGINLDWSFYCTSSGKGTMEEKARRLGAHVLYSPVPVEQKLKFTLALRSKLKQGRYNVLHCHHDVISAVYLLASLGAPVGRRIVHVHNADESVLTPSAWKQRLYRPVLRRVCLALADRIAGISNHTLDSVLAGHPRRAGRDMVLYYGVDHAPFAGVQADRVAFRRDLGLLPDALVLLFAGRVVPEKNPVFAVEVLFELRRFEPRAVAVFAGSGSLMECVRERARELGIEPWIRLLGWRNDLPELMSASDLFILPRPERPMEGFGLAVVEAQLAGLRLLLSQGIPDDSLLPTASYRRLPLATGAREWAKAGMELLASPANTSASALAALEKSPMQMDRALDELLKLHL